MPTGIRQTDEHSLSELLIRHETEIASAWITEQSTLVSHRPDLISEADLRQQSRALLAEIVAAARVDPTLTLTNAVWRPTRDMLQEMSRARAAALRCQDRPRHPA